MYMKHSLSVTKYLFSKRGEIMNGSETVFIVILKLCSQLKQKNTFDRCLSQLKQHYPLIKVRNTTTT
jgi:hypothetical protein